MCPNYNEPLIVLDWQGVEIDMCASCGGVWLDAGELEFIGEKAGADTGDLTGMLERARRGDLTKRPCPRCGRKLRALHACEDEPVELDHCPRGHGIWFDRGELQSFVGACGTGEEGAVARFFADLFRSELDTGTKGE